MKKLSKTMKKNNKNGEDEEEEVEQEEDEDEEEGEQKSASPSLQFEGVKEFSSIATQTDDLETSTQSVQVNRSLSNFYSIVNSSHLDNR